VFLNDTIDYGLGVYPWLFQEIDALAIRNFTLLLSGVLAGGIMVSIHMMNRLEEERGREVCIST
jgi:hypothetical protein